LDLYTDIQIDGERMNKNSLYALLCLTGIWIILMESFSPVTIVTGILLSVACLWFSQKFLPLDKIKDVRFSRLILYPFFLGKEIYLQGFQVIKLIISGPKVDVVHLQTELRSDFLKAALLNSITLTPGSVPLDLKENRLGVVYLCSPDAKDPRGDFKKNVDRLEQQLHKAQK